MITEHNINETLAWKMTPQMKLAYLEFVQDRLEELFEALTITEADYKYLMKVTNKKAKILLKEHPEAFKTNQNNDG